MVATAVPHEPAPMTATRSLMVQETTAARPRCRFRARPYTVAVPRATLQAPFGSDADDTRLGHEVVLIPVKAFQQAKRRLGPALTDADRMKLVRAMATHVVSACAPLPVAVVCDDEEVARWASNLGAFVMWEPGQGLNGAVRAGVDRLAQAGATWVTVAHGDLPRASGLGTLPPFEGVTLVPDRKDDGTNVLRLRAASDFRFAYGPGSFRAHREEAARLGLPVRVLRKPDLAYDVDWPADVAELDAPA